MHGRRFGYVDGGRCPIPPTNISLCLWWSCHDNSLSHWHRWQFGAQFLSKDTLTCRPEEPVNKLPTLRFSLTSRSTSWAAAASSTCAIILDGRNKDDDDDDNDSVPGRIETMTCWWIQAFNKERQFKSGSTVLFSTCCQWQPSTSSPAHLLQQRALKWYITWCPGSSMPVACRQSKQVKQCLKSAL